MKKLLLFGLIGLFSLAGCSKDEDENASPSASIMYKGEALDLVVATATQPTYNDGYTTRYISFQDQTGQLKVGVHASYYDPEQFGVASFPYVSWQDADPQAHHFSSGSLSFDSNGDGQFNLNGEYKITMTGGTFSITEYSVEDNKMSATLDLELSNGETIKGNFSGLFVESGI